jgi:HEPN domain-containing protein
VNSFDEQAIALLEAAQRDRITLRILLRDPEAPLETTLFHAQQALEKGIKAALVCSGVVFQRTHDLVQLAELIDAHDLKLPLDRHLMARLAPYAVEFRYLGVVAPEVEQTEAEMAVETMMNWLKLQFGLELAR